MTPGAAIGDPARRAVRCAACRHRDPDPGRIERAVAGLVVFSSGYGSSVADSRLCVLRDQFVSPDDGCAAFAPKAKGARADGLAGFDIKT